MQPLAGTVRRWLVVLAVAALLSACSQGGHGAGAPASAVSVEPTDTVASTATHAPATASPTPSPALATPSGSPTPTATATAAIPVGAGPQRVYTVQPQPPAGSCHYTYVDQTAGDVLPDRTCTPGAVSPAVTQANLASTICKSGYTASVRPPESVTEAEKIANARSYGYTGSLHVGEFDHLIPLELGGDPNDPRNLWVEPNRTSATSFNNPKDRVESALNDLVCNVIHGKPYLPLATAQRLIATDWITAETLAERSLVGTWARGAGIRVSAG